MLSVCLLLVTALASSAVSADEVRWFPGDYFESRVRAGFQRQVLERWPGPTALERKWRDGGLEGEERVRLLLGAAAFHDPTLLPIYREALGSSSQRLRQAAAYGYRDLIADRVPDVSGGIDDRVAAALRGELDAVASTLERRSLLEMWLHAALVHEGSGLPGWDGVTLHRPVESCLRAVEVVAGVGDLELLVAAFRGSSSLALRTNLVKIIEAVTLSRFLVMPEDPREGWGAHVFETAIDSLESAIRRWSGDDCSLDGEAVLRDNLATLGVPGVEPLAPEACVLWVNVLDRGYPRWWAMASRQLYACGGPWVELSALDSDSEANRNRRQNLLQWFHPLTVAGMPRPGSR